MKSITVEDLYLQSKVDEFEDYSLYVKLGDERVPLVVHEICPEDKKLVLWPEAELEIHLQELRDKFTQRKTE
ncbi:MAG: hypothetical protein IJF83_03160 [Methanobrevibacter sp.]|nr:hypothetical protein [Methanobrevibacter sp.]